MKKKGKKLISIALTVAMIAGLTACGKGNGGNGNGGSSAADASLAKQYVFKEQALDLNMDSDNMNIDLLTRRVWQVAAQTLLSLTCLVFILFPHIHWKR